MTEPFDPFEPQQTQHIQQNMPNEPTRQLPFAQAGRPPVWRRRGWQVGSGIGVLAVAGLVVGLVLAAGSGGSQPTDTAAAQSSPGSSAPATPGPAQGGAAQGGTKHGKGAGAGKHMAIKIQQGENVLYGTVSSVSGSTLNLELIGPQGQVAIATDGSTKITGDTVTSVADLKPGAEVDVVVSGSTAITIRVVRNE